MARALLLGLLVGFPIAASPGPIFFLVLRRTLARGWLSGAVCGLGVATGDAIYAALAAFGVTAITSLLISQRRWIGLFGGIAIIVIGARIVVSCAKPLPGPPPEEEGSRAPGERSQLAGAYASIVGLTLSNPLTILSFSAVFAGLGVHVATGWMPALALVIGVMLGSATWWAVMTTTAALFRARMTPAITGGIGIMSALALIGFGIFTISTALLP